MYFPIIKCMKKIKINILSMVYRISLINNIGKILFKALLGH